VRDIGGGEQILGPPRLRNMTLKRAGTDPISAEAQLVGIQFGGVQSPKGLVLPADGEEKLVLTMTGLSEPGRYDGVLRLMALGRNPADIPFALIVRESWVAAALLVGIGVLLSFLIRRYFSTGRTRLIRQAAIARLSRQLMAVAEHSPPDSESARRVLNTIEHSMDVLAGDLAGDRTLDLDERIAVVRGRMALYEELTGISRRMAGLSADKRAEVRGTLEQQADVLSRQGTSRQELVSVADALAGIKMGALERRALAEASTALDRAINQQRACLPGDRVRRLDEVVGREFSEAMDHFERDELAAARKTLTNARLLFARFLAEGLNAQLAESPPPGLTEGAWANVRNEVLGALGEIDVSTDADAAVLKYRRAAGRFSRALIEGLTRAARARSRELLIIPLGAAENQRLAQVLEAVEKALKDASEQEPETAMGSYRDARALYERALEDMHPPTAIREHDVAGGPETTLDRGHRTNDAGGWVVALVPELAPRVQSAALPIDRQIESADLAAQVSLLVLAVLSGLKVLWLDDPAWGGKGAYLTALLWGAGLHAAGNAAFEGLQRLRERLTKAD
jgi:hypothetical protein